jgi:hypothetical protein
MSATASDPSGLIERLTAEGVLSLGEIARRLGSLRGKRPVHASRVGRWVTAGCELADGRTVRLEAVRVSGQRCSSWPAVIRYLGEQTRAAGREATRG